VSKSIEWKCDGCDEVVRTDPAHTPHNWLPITVQMSGHGHWQTDRDEPATYDLCRSCRDRLWDVVRPTNWPRSAKEGRRG
jgi:hypothetical protein